MSEIELPRSFEQHIEAVAEEREGALNTAVMIQMLMWMIPLLACSFGFQILVFSLGFEPLISIALVVSIGVPALYAMREWTIRQTEYLKGREMLILRFRLRRGKWFEDYALVKSWKLLNPKAESLSAVVPEFKANPHDIPLYLYEVEFEDFPYFDKMVIYSPCPKDQLIEMTPQVVLWKQFIVGAQAAALSVVLLKEVLLGPEGIVPHVYPIDSDWEAERMQSLVGIIPVTKGVVEEGAKIYEAVKYEEILKLYEGVQRENKTLLSIIESMENKAALMAAKLAEEMIEASKVKVGHEIGESFSAWIRRHKKLLLAILVASAVILFILYGGYVVQLMR